MKTNYLLCYENEKDKTIIVKILCKANDIVIKSNKKIILVTPKNIESEEENENWFKNEENKENIIIIENEEDKSKEIEQMKLKEKNEENKIKEKETCKKKRLKMDY